MWIMTLSMWALAAPGTPQEIALDHLDGIYEGEVAFQAQTSVPWAAGTPSTASFAEAAPRWVPSRGWMPSSCMKRP